MPHMTDLPGELLHRINANLDTTDRQYRANTWQQPRDEPSTLVSCLVLFSVTCVLTIGLLVLAAVRG